MIGQLKARQVVGAFASSCIASLSVFSLMACEKKNDSKSATDAVDAGQEYPLRRARVPSHADVIVHMFDVPFRSIQAELPTLARAGYGAVQVSPPQLSNGDAWWGRYQPLDYRVIDSPLGNENDLRSLVREAASYGIRINVDLVLNHMANLGRDHDGQYPPQWAQKKYGVSGLFSPADFNAPFCISNWGNLGEVRAGRICGGGDDPGLPDLRQDAGWVLEQQRAFIAKLNGIGVAGYRIDAVKHMDVAYFGKLLTPELTKGKNVYGEVIAFKSSFDSDLEPYLRGTSMGFMDFPLQETIRNAFKPSGSLAALIEPVKDNAALAWDRGVTFVVNHDIPNNEGFRYMIMDETDEALGYAYILGRADGVPHVMSDRGKEGGLREDRWKNAHRRKDLASMVKFHNAVHGAAQKVVYADSCALVFEREEKGLVGINKCGHEIRAKIRTRIPDAATDVLTGKSALLGGETELSLPSRSAVMYLSNSAVR